MVKFIHTADIHLDSPLKGLEAHEDAPVEEIRGATRRAFDNMIELAIEENVDFVLIAGDLYDGDWKDYNTGLFFAGRMRKLSRAGIRVFIVSGNHDAASQITRAMPLPENVTFLSTKKPQSVKLDDLGVIIHGQGYSVRAVTDNLACRYPQYDPGYFNIGMLHTSLTGRQGHENYAPCSTDELKSTAGNPQPMCPTSISCFLLQKLRNKALKAMITGLWDMFINGKLFIKIPGLYFRVTYRAVT